MNRDERALLLSELTTLRGLLEQTPAEDVLDRASIESRMRMVQSALDSNPPDERAPARVRLTFRGRPVVGSRGIFATFGAAATQAFAEVVAKAAAGMTAPLAQSGPVPNREEHELLITGTALGSFGFELEEHREAPLLVGETNLAAALEQTCQLFAAATRDDEQLADAVSAMDRRAVLAAKTFLETLASSEAHCAIECEGHTVVFDSVDDVRRGAARLADSNLRAQERTLLGAFLGVLPFARTFEFRVGESDEVIRGKVGPEIADAAMLKPRLDEPLAIRVTETRIGTGRPRYVLRGIVS